MSIFTIWQLSLLISPVIYGSRTLPAWSRSETGRQFRDRISKVANQVEAAIWDGLMMAEARSSKGLQDLRQTAKRNNNYFHIIYGSDKNTFDENKRLAPIEPWDRISRVAFVLRVCQNRNSSPEDSALYEVVATFTAIHRSIPNSYHRKNEFIHAFMTCKMTMKCWILRDYAQKDAKRLKKFTQVAEYFRPTLPEHPHPSASEHWVAIVKREPTCPLYPNQFIHSMLLPQMSSMFSKELLMLILDDHLKDIKVDSRFMWALLIKGSEWLSLHLLSYDFSLDSRNKMFPMMDYPPMLSLMPKTVQEAVLIHIPIRKSLEGLHKGTATWNPDTQELSLKTGMRLKPYWINFPFDFGWDTSNLDFSDKFKGHVMYGTFNLRRKAWRVNQLNPAPGELLVIGYTNSHKKWVSILKHAPQELQFYLLSEFRMSIFIRTIDSDPKTN